MGRDFKTEMEVQAELQLKNAEFRPENSLSKVKELIEAQKMVVSSAESGLHECTQLAAGALDAAQWNFLEKQLHVDVQTAIVYRRSLSNVEIAGSGCWTGCRTRQPSRAGSSHLVLAAASKSTSWTPRMDRRKS